MTLDDAFAAHCCTLSMRILRRFRRWQVRNAANDNGGGVAA
jgi:hypothetical protein